MASSKSDKAESVASYKSVNSLESTVIEVSQSEKMSRSQGLQLINEIKQVIEDQSLVNKSVLLELGSNISIPRLEHIRDELRNALGHVSRKYSQYQQHQTSMGFDDRRTLREVDQLTADIKYVEDKVTSALDNLRGKLNPLDSCQRSIAGSVRSKSGTHRSGSSRTSDSLRMKAAEAKAAAAAKQAQLEAELDAQRLEEDNQRLLAIQQKQARTISQLRLRGEIEAEKRKHQILSEAIEEEECQDRNVLLRPPSVVVTRVKDIPILEPPRPKAPAVVETGVQDGPISEPLLSTTVQAPQDHASTPNIINSTDSSGLATSIAEAINTIRLKPAEPPVFNGDPLQYADWKVAFENLVEGRSGSPVEKLINLQQYVGGKAKAAVSGYFRLGTEQAYLEAKAKLESRYGKPQIVSEAFRAKLKKWPTIKEGDGEALQSFTDFLESCSTAMDSAPELKILNDREENAKLVDKLPASIVGKWVRKVTEIESKSARFPSFDTFCKFLSYESDVATNSLTKLLNASANKSKPKSKYETENTHKHPSSTHERKPVTLQTTSNSKVPTKPAQKRSTSCAYCEMDNHNTSVCYKLGKLDYADQKAFLQEMGLCYSCSKPNHMAKDCMKKANCRKCDKQHLSIFHDHFETQSKKRVENAEAPHHATNGKTNTSTNSDTMSMTIPVYVSSKDEPHHEVLVYALLDSGSDTTFISDNTLDQLNAEKTGTTLKVTTMTSKMQVKCTKVEGLRVRGYKSDKHVDLPTVFSQKEIPMNRSHIPNAQTVEQWSHLSHLAPCLIPKDTKVEVGLLIGYDLSQVFIPREVVTGTDHEPFAQLTDLGWCIIGKVNQDQTFCNQVSVSKTIQHPTDKSAVTFSCHASEVSTERVLKALQADFNEKSSNNQEPAMSIDDKLFMNILESNTTKDEKGFVSMPLPFKTKPPANRSKLVAERRFDLLSKKLVKDPLYSTHYRDFMKQIIDAGDAEIVPEEQLENKDSWYIPHFGVYHPKKQKIRVVFDCSAKSDGQCLNDFLLQGPDQLNSLVGILLRFRQEQIAITCDIEKMFHQFKVFPEQRDYLRFLWFDDKGAVVTYRMKVHLFGAKSSPGCATYGLRALTKMTKNEYPPSLEEFVTKDFYVDDGLTSVETIEQAQDLINNAIKLCKEGNLRLHKFMSNNKDVLETIPESERSIQELQIMDNKDNVNAPLERTLGISWAIGQDSFKFNISLKDNPATRRGILGTIASVYDPLGFISPFVLRGKQLLQSLCKTACGWDDPISQELEKEWNSWKAQLTDLDQLTINRCYKPARMGNITSAQLHTFADASSTGYGAVSYLRLVDQEQHVHCSLLMSKARVAPTKAVTIPRLELQAAVVAANLSKLILKELELNIEVTQHFWTDSLVVLGYINNEEKRFRTYVANRVQQIRDVSQPEQWHHVSTTENPADHASRGLSAKDLGSSNWFTGPSFLWTDWHPIRQPEHYHIEPNDPEVHSLHITKPAPNIADRVQRFSCWHKAVRAIQVILRKVYKIKGKPISDAALHRATELLILKATQADHFDEIDLLKKGKEIPSSSSLYKLQPYLDQDGLMRVGGRLKFSLLEEAEKHPIILPKTSHTTKLIVRHYHSQIAHQGRAMTLAKIRSNGYWIVGARGVVASEIYSCITCRRLRAKPTVPHMAPLPDVRAIPQPPFTAVGVDCFGPFLVRDRRTEVKRYGLMVTCLASRAVHIEVLDDMTTTSFINSMRIVEAIRGPIKEIRCDRGTNFVGAIPELTKQGKLAVVLNPPKASHMGGAWERMIRTARNILMGMSRSYGGRLDTSGLRTLCYEVMAIMNSRPLGPVNEEQLPLTPNMLLTMKSEVILPPPGHFEEADIYAKKRWRAVQHLANVFWQRWKTEYLAELQSRQKWNKQITNIKTGTIVLLSDEDTYRNDWSIGKVTKCIESKDSVVRSVEILVGNRESPTKSNRVLTRPVSKLIVLLNPSD